MANQCREFTLEFKLKAINLVDDHKCKITKVAESLGIHTCILDS